MIPHAICTEGQMFARWMAVQTGTSAFQVKAMRSEAEIIERISRWLANSRPSRYKLAMLRAGIGDDAAVLRGARRAADLVLSCDAFLENVHFRADVHPSHAIGYKALARATSDLAAMGAVPRFFMVSLALPPGRTGTWLDGAIKGLARAAREFGMVLIGGDTSQSASVIMNITVGGEVASGRALRRSGARPGDGIYVSGTLGAAQLGLELILRGMHRDVRWKRLLEPHLRPKIQVALGRWLAGGTRRRPIASAATDTSDGLSTDLTHICQSSGVCARIFAAQIPVVGAPAPLQRLGLDPLELALHGGEDYQLLFTVPVGQESRIRREYLGVPVTRIGEIVAASKNAGRRKRISGSLIELVGASGKATSLAPRGWDHFKRS
jgi:thiamine-monophosphate kinase